MSQRTPGPGLPVLAGTSVDRRLLALPVLAALVTGLALGAPVPWGLALLVLAAAVLLGVSVWRRPLLVVALIPALLPPPEFLKMFAYEVSLGLVAAVVLFAGVRWRRAWVAKLDPIELAVAAFLAWGMVSLLWSSSTWWWLFAVRKYGIGLLALWTTWRLARDLRARDLDLGVTVGALALALATLVRALQSGLLTAGTGFSRREGTDLGWGTSNYIAALLVLMLPTALNLALHSPRRTARVLGWTTLPFAALVMAIAASRGGALLMVTVALLYIFRQRIGRRTMLLGLGLAVALGLLIAGPGSGLFLSRFTSPRELGSILVRLFLLRAGWRRLVDHFPLGMGMGQGIVEPDHLGAGGPHNYFVLLGSEVGIPGVILWIVVIVLIWRRGWRYLHDPAKALTAQALLMTLAIGVANSMFEGTFEGLQYQFLFFWIVGAYLGALERPDAVSLPAPPAHASGPGDGRVAEAVTPAG